MIKNLEEQRKNMGSPKEHLKGHAYHTYTLTSPDGTYVTCLINICNPIKGTLHNENMMFAKILRL